jgi:hypothetical protein
MKPTSKTYFIACRDFGSEVIKTTAKTLSGAKNTCTRKFGNASSSIKVYQLTNNGLIQVAFKFNNGVWVG